MAFLKFAKKQQTRTSSYHALNQNETDKSCQCMKWMPTIFHGMLRKLFVKESPSHDRSSFHNPPLREDNPILDLSSFHNIPLHGHTPLLDDNHCRDDSLLQDAPLSDDHDDKIYHENNLLLLPDDIIIDVLSRITFEGILQCRRVCKSLCERMSVPSFVAMQLKQFTPILVVQNYSWFFSVYDDDAHLYTCDVMLLAVDGRNKIEPGRKQFTMSFMPDSYDKPSLIASFYGFLLFRSRGHALYIWNPVTQEQVTVTAPTIGIFTYEDCGLFFHTPTSEYRILYSRRHNTTGQNEFYVLSLRTAVLRKISNCTVSPCTCRPPIILNDRLHWMAAFEVPCRGQEFPTCLESILLFKMESEELITMPHPGSPCCSKERHGTMQLLEMEGQLGLCDFSVSTAEFYLWVMEDYLNQVWVKRHIISLKPLTSELCLRSNYDHTFPEVEVFKVHHDQLLLICGSPKRWHYYDLKLKIFRNVGRLHFLNGSGLSRVVPHTNTLASLHTNSFISCKVDPER